VTLVVDIALATAVEVYVYVPPANVGERVTSERARAERLDVASCVYTPEVPIALSG